MRVGDDLETLLTRPLDFERIDERIADRRAERERIEAERERAAEAASRRARLDGRVEDLRARLESLRADWEALDVQGGDDDARDSLSDRRAARERVDTEVARLESTLAHRRESLDERRRELEELDVPEGEAVEEDIEARRSTLRTLERDAELLQSVHEATKRVLDEGRVGLLTDVSHGLDADEFDCWICGTETTHADVEAHLSGIDDRLGEMRERIAETRADVERLRETRADVERAERRRTELADRIGDLEARVAETEADLEAARDRRDELDAEIDALAARADEAEARATDLQSEIKYAEAELDDATEELEAATAEAERLDALEEARASLSEDLARLRTRKERIQRETREAFDDALADLLDRFDVGFELARLTDGFDLVVARGGREASLDALSEGERELLGIVAALAGHEAFDVAERLPVMVLDGHTGLDDGNLHTLVDYLESRAEILVLSAYPGYERFDGHEISPADWRTVSFDPTSPTGTSPP